MYSLQPGELGEYEISFISETVNYPEGDYRNVKQISIDEKNMKPYYSNFQIIEPR